MGGIGHKSPSVSKADYNVQLEQTQIKSKIK